MDSRESIHVLPHSLFVEMWRLGRFASFRINSWRREGICVGRTLE